MLCRFAHVLLGTALFAMSGLADTWHVSANSASDGPGTAWSNAFHTIQAAVDAAASNDTVLVTNGVYDTGATVRYGLNRVVITNDIVVRSVNGAGVTFIKGAEATGGGNGDDAVRGVYMSAGVLDGFTVTNGHTGAIGVFAWGGGICMQSDDVVARNCILTGNSAYNGGGSCMGTLNNCIISGNSATNGGGSFQGTHNNCTLTDNSASGLGGGNCAGTLNNSIIYFNSSDLGDANNWYDSTLSYSCTTPLPGGIGNIDDNPMFVSSSHIHADSPCAGAGLTNFISGSDIDGDAWKNPPSMGCDEPMAPFLGDLAVSIITPPTNNYRYHRLFLSADIQGVPASNRWDFGDGYFLENSLYDVSHRWSATGEFPVTLTAWNDDNPGGVSATVIVSVVSGADHYVNASNQTPSSPYTSWETAATEIQDAIDAASDGDAVLVTNGVYDVGTAQTPGYASLNRVVLGKDIAVSSVNGPEATIIKGAEATGGGNGSNAVRGVSMGAGILSGFTIVNGHTMISGDDGYDNSGGGVNLYGGNGAVKNCIITGNSAALNGGGSYYGTLNNCAINENSASSGGGSYYGTLSNCTLAGNTAESDGGGSYRGTLNNSIIYLNTAGSLGDNLHQSTLRYSCSMPRRAGIGNIGDPPMLLDQFHISPDSPCVGGGSGSYVSGADLDGNAWKTLPSMGCDEPLSPFEGNLGVSIRASRAVALAGQELSFIADVEGVPVSNRWDFGDGAFSTNVSYVSHSWSTVGEYRVALTAWNDDNPNGITSVKSIYITPNADFYVDASNLSPVAPFSTWDTAATEIQDAVDIAEYGDLVLVASGVYESGSTVTPGHSCLNRLVITNNITVRAVSSPQDTIIRGAESTDGGNGSNAVRCVYMREGILAGFTISNGHTMTSGDLHFDRSGGGVNMYGGNGRVENCIVADNSAFHGGGSYQGRVFNSVIRGNSADYGGGGSYGFLYNCTLYGNSVVNRGGGSYSGSLKNCIAYYNTAGTSVDNWYNSTISYSCTTPDPGGTGNITNAPLLISSSHIHADSPCVGAGSGSYASGTDIDGDVWQSPPSMGCDEPLGPFSGEIDVSLTVAYTNITQGYVLGFDADILGEVASNRWDFGDGTYLTNKYHDVSHSWGSAGAYEVALTAWNDDNLNGISATVAVHVASDCYYVDISNNSPVYPHSSWDTAARSIQDAVDATIGLIGEVTVFVTNGIYQTGTRGTPGYTALNRVVITNDITVVSVNGPDVTIIKGSEATGGGNGDDAVRGVYMSAGALSGFTVTNGHTRTTGSYEYDRSGGGVHMRSGSGILNNCILSGNNSAYYGGGSYYGTLNNCALLGNSAYSRGGGSYYGTLNNCTIAGNSSTIASGAGGSYNGVRRNCIVYFNTADSQVSNWSGSGMAYSCTTPLHEGTGNIATDPQFVDVSTGDFRLRTSSPCIDSGDNAAVVGGNDIDGRPRIWNGVVDMGAYEYQWLDSDGDGMPDWWESLGGGSSTGLIAGVDTDGDGKSNYDEWIAGMNASDPESVFGVRSASNATSSGFVVNWESIAGRIYGLHWSSNLMSGFVPLDTNLHYPRNSYTDTLHQAEDEGYYRLDVRME